MVQLQGCASYAGRMVAPLLVTFLTWGLMVLINNAESLKQRQLRCEGEDREGRALLRLREERGFTAGPATRAVLRLHGARAAEGKTEPVLGRNPSQSHSGAAWKCYMTAYSDKLPLP